MGLFKKKSDPLSERAQALAAEIAALEAQIQQLSAQDCKSPPAPDPSAATRVAPPAKEPPAPAPAVAQPKLRSTALPHHRQAALVASASASVARDPVFEEVDQNRLHSEREPAVHENSELDVRRNGPAGFWQRFATHFRGPPTSNPKLVNYLAAGSIQGLRPLRYERRVARNRFLVLVVILVLILWGLIAIFWKNHK